MAPDGKQSQFTGENQENGDKKRPGVSPGKNPRKRKIFFLKNPVGSCDSWMKIKKPCVKQMVPGILSRHGLLRGWNPEKPVLFFACSPGLASGEFILVSAGFFRGSLPCSPSELPGKSPDPGKDSHPEDGMGKKIPLKSPSALPPKIPLSGAIPSTCQPASLVQIKQVE